MFMFGVGTKKPAEEKFWERDTGTKSDALGWEIPTLEGEIFKQMFLTQLQISSWKLDMAVSNPVLVVKSLPMRT